MTGARPLEVGVAELLRHPGAPRPVHVEAVLDDLATSSAAVRAGEPVTADLVLEATGGSVVADGVVRAPWRGDCRRCLEPVEDVLETEVREVFERHPSEGETYPLGEDSIDVEPLVRDAVLLALPLAPLCDPDCAGPAPEAFPAAVEGEGAEDEPGSGEPPRDPRWAALDDLRFDG